MAQVSYGRTVASDNVVKYFQSSSIVRIKVTELLKHPFNKYVEIVETFGVLTYFVFTYTECPWQIKKNILLLITSLQNVDTRFGYDQKIKDEMPLRFTKYFRLFMRRKQLLFFVMFRYKKWKKVFNL